MACEGDWQGAFCTTKWQWERQEASSLRDAEAQGARSSRERRIREAEGSQGEGCGVHSGPLLRRGVKCIVSSKEAGNQRRLHFSEADMQGARGCVTHTSRKLYRNWCCLPSVDNRAAAGLNPDLLMGFAPLRSESCTTVLTYCFIEDEKRGCYEIATILRLS
jgi:hypothetical protein